MAFFNQSVTVRKPVSKIVSKDYRGNQYAAGVARSVQLTPGNPTTVLEDWGFALERPHVLYDLVSAASEYEIMGLVIYGARYFRIEAIKIWDAADSAVNSVEVLLEEVQALATSEPENVT